MYKHVTAIRALWTNWHKTLCFTYPDNLGNSPLCFPGRNKGSGGGFCPKSTDVQVLPLTLKNTVCDSLYA